MSVRNLGPAVIVGAEALGQPGQRRFRLFARTEGFSAFWWLEKEQLLNLSVAIDRVMVEVSHGRILRVEAQAGGLPPQPGDLPDDFPLLPDYDFQIGQLGLSFDGQAFLLLVTPFEIREEKSGEPEIVLQSDDALALPFTVEQALQLSSRITFVVEGGRPVCPHCHQLLDGSPHACTKQNGHRQIIQIIMDDDDSDEEGA
jgi:uncharacterized repeat protein (TIGR03847 family)